MLPALGHLQPRVIDAGSDQNLADLRCFLEAELQARKLQVDDSAIRTILDRSQGLFLYVRVMLDELDVGHLSLEKPEDLPIGLYGHYQRFFGRSVSGYRAVSS